MGLAWRITYVLVVTRYQNASLYDAAWYELQALTLASGHFFRVPSNSGPTPPTRRSPPWPSPR